MAVKKKEELMEALRQRIGEDTSDEALSLIEDFNDTMEQYEKSNSDSTDWKTKYEENDAQWRQRYKDRFFSKADDDEDSTEEEEKTVPMNFSDLFKGE